LATKILQEFKNDTNHQHDASTVNLLNYYKNAHI
jgi:hypothetical protein